MALSAPLLAPPLASERIGTAVAPPVLSRRAARAELTRARDLSADYFALSWSAMLFYFTVPMSADMLLIRIPELLGIQPAGVAELAVQYWILALVAGALAFLTLAAGVFTAPVRRWWHWPLFDSLSLALLAGLALQCWGVTHLQLSSCWGYLIPVPSC